MGERSNNSWKRVINRAGVKQTIVHQAHEGKLYIETDHLDDPVMEMTKRLQIEKPIDKNALKKLSGRNVGRIRWMFNWPNTIIQAQAHARFPDIKSSDIELRLKAYHDMAKAYPKHSVEI